MTGKIQIVIYGPAGDIKGDYSLNNNVQDTVIFALADKIRKDTPFANEYVPNFMIVGNNLNQYQTLRISARSRTSEGGMYFFVDGIQFEQGEDNMHIRLVGLQGEDASGLIAYAYGSDINGVLFNPSDTIKVAYTINVAPAEINTNLANAYFREVASVMLGGPDSGGVYVAINEKYVVPNQAKLLSETTGLIDSKAFIPKGTGSFIGTSEGDLEWDGADGGPTPYYVQWLSNYSGRPDLILGTTDLNQDLRDAYPSGTNIETRFSIELKN